MVELVAILYQVAKQIYSVDMVPGLGKLLQN